MDCMINPVLSIAAIASSTSWFAAVVDCVTGISLRGSVEIKLIRAINTITASSASMDIAIPLCPGIIYCEFRNYFRPFKVYYSFHINGHVVVPPVVSRLACTVYGCVIRIAYSEIIVVAY